PGAKGVPAARAGASQGLMRAFGLLMATIAAALSGIAYETGGPPAVVGGAAGGVGGAGAAGRLGTRAARRRARAAADASVASAAIAAAEASTVEAREPSTVAV